MAKPKSLAPTLMVQGTASSVGKSVLVTGLCRLFAQQGLRVAPFKAQNMSLNSFATPDGREIGRAQAVQAAAAGTVASVDMNPILLKPVKGSRAQVVLRGKPVGDLDGYDYRTRRQELGAVIDESLGRLRTQYDLVVIEGAGSPAEINLKQRDIANMFVAQRAGAPVLLAGDIDRGGVFAALLGTLELLEADERARVAGLIINRFRGDPALLEPGLPSLEARTGVPVLGVVPYLDELGIADEDSAALDEQPRPRSAEAELDVAVLRFPHLSNYDDLLPLEREPAVRLRYVTRAEQWAGADLPILPGTKSTLLDLEWLRQQGLEAPIAHWAQQGHPLLGICGGYQMLGSELSDPQGVDGRAGRAQGLGILPCNTRFEPTKVTRQVQALVVGGFFADTAQPRSSAGYEIHMGRVQLHPGAVPALMLESGPEGCVGNTGRVVGTLVHGLLDDDGVRERLIGALRARRGLSPHYRARPHNPEAAFDRLAATLSQSLKMERIQALLAQPAGEAC